MSYVVIFLAIFPFMTWYVISGYPEYAQWVEKKRREEAWKREATYRPSCYRVEVIDTKHPAYRIVEDDRKLYDWDE